MLTWCQQMMSTIITVRYKSIRYMKVFLREFDYNSVSSMKICPRLKGACYSQVG